MVNLLKKIAKLAIVSIVGLYGLIWALSPYLANYWVSDYLETQQLTLSSSSTIRYNPFTSHLSIHDVIIKNKQSVKVASISTLSLQLSLYRLFENEINVSEFNVDGLYIAVNKDAALLQVAGIQIPASIDGREKIIEAVDDGPEHQISAFPFQLVMKKMTLQNSLIDLVEKGEKHLLKLNDMTITDVEASESSQRLSVSLLGELNDANISLLVNAEIVDRLGTLNVEVSVSDLNLHEFTYLVHPHVEVLEGLISYRGIHNINLTDSGTRIDIEDLNFTSQNFEVHKNGLQLLLGEQALKTDLLSVQISSGADVGVLVEGDLLFRDINIYNKIQSKILLALNELALNKIALRSDGVQHILTVNDIIFLNSLFSDDIENEIPTLAEFSSLSINDTQLTNSSLSINTIELGGFKSNAQLNKDKVIQNIIISTEELAAAFRGDNTFDDEKGENDEAEKVIEASARSEETLEEQSFSFKLNQFSLVDSAGIQFSDFSVSPSYNRTILFEEVSAGPFDTQIPEQKSIINLKGRSDKYAKFDVTVNAKPFLDVPHYSLQGSIKEIDLPGLTAYIKTALGYSINSGQLDLDIDVELVGSTMKGESTVLLRGIELTSINNDELETSSIQTSIPFNAALGMLKDGDGNVELDLPLSGDINSPSFGLSGFLTLLVKQATIIGAREYLAVTLVPYAGLVTVIVVADRYMLKVQINNLNFPPESDAVPIDNEMFLSKFSSLLKDKPQLSVKFCGVSTPEDIGKQKGDMINSSNDIAALKAIAIKRALNFKEYMVQEKGINSSRLLLCNPKIDSSIKAIPHIRFET